MILISSLLAQTNDAGSRRSIGGDIGKLGGYAPETIEETGVANSAIGQFAAFASNVLGFLSVIAGIMFLLYFMLGAISWLTAGGDEGKAEKAKTQLSNAAIGLIIVALAYSITFIVGKVVGIDILNPANILKNLIPGGSSGVAPDHYVTREEYLYNNQGTQ